MDDARNMDHGPGVRNDRYAESGSHETQRRNFVVDFVEARGAIAVTQREFDRGVVQ